MWDYLWTHMALGEVLRGAVMTLELTALSMPLAVVAGLVLATMRMSRHRWLSWPALGYIEVIRGTPLLVQIFLVYYGLPELGQKLADRIPALQSLSVQDLLTWRGFAAGVFCLSANYAAYEAEILRAGLEAVDKGQREAALAIGMSEGQGFFRIVLPQAFRIVVPPLVNDLIAMLKDSCLVYAMGLAELLTVSIRIGRTRFNYLEMLLQAAAIYLILSLACSALGKFLADRLKVRGGLELRREGPRHGH